VKKKKIFKQNKKNLKRFHHRESKNWGSKNRSHCWKGLKYAKYAGKLKNFQDLKDFSEEHWV